MPQGSGDASLLSSTLPHPKIKDLTEANAALRKVAPHDVPILIKPIPLHRLRLLTFSDGSLGNAGGGSAQIGHLVCAADKSIHEGS